MAVTRLALGRGGGREREKRRGEEKECACEYIRDEIAQLCVECRHFYGYHITSRTPESVSVKTDYISHSAPVQTTTCRSYTHPATVLLIGLKHFSVLEEIETIYFGFWVTF